MKTNKIQVTDRKYYEEFDGIRLIYEDGELVGWYRPNTIDADGEFAHTIESMGSENYKERFKAEYQQTKIRYEKLKKFTTAIEAAKMTQYEGFKVEEPKHDCPLELLREQQNIMGNYLHILELRAVIEGVEL